MKKLTIAFLLTVVACIISMIVNVAATDQDTKDNAQIAESFFCCVSCILLCSVVVMGKTVSRQT